MIQRFLLHWRAKLIAFLLAFILWLILKEKIDPGTINQILHDTLPTLSS